jgi:hypothetical protein
MQVARSFSPRHLAEGTARHGERQAPSLGGPEGPEWGPLVTVFRGVQTEDHVIEQFAESFPGASEATLRQEIITRNATAVGCGTAFTV